jgi:phosphoserine phosphatase
MKCTCVNFALLVVSLICASPAYAKPGYGPLPSWNNSPAKQTIVRFVDAVSDPHNDSYVPLNRRIAVVDKDGTLMVEKPLPAIVMFSIERLRTLVNRRPELKGQEVYAAASENNLNYFIRLKNRNFPHLLGVALSALSGMPQSLFKLESRTFLEKHLHPDFKVPYRDLVYQPMLELLRLLERKGFSVFLVTGSSSGFARGAAQNIYQIPDENVIGSSVELEYAMTERGPLLIRGTQNLEPSNVRKGKPINIHRHIGQRPILAIGNSDGDLDMFEFTTVAHPSSLAVLLHHDDAAREYAYDKGAEKVLEMASSRGWTVISMKQDFRTVFKFERK